MSKNAARGYFVLGVILAVYSVIAFVVPFTRSGSFWTGYVFGVIAILFQIYVFKVSFANGESVKSRFYGFPIARLGVIYLILQLILGIAEMAITKFIPVWVSVIVNVILLAFALIGCIAAEIMRDEIVRQDVKIKTDVNNMRSLQSLSASLVSMCSDSDIKKELQNLSDEFRYSDPVSSDATRELENELKTLVGEIQRTLIDGENSSINGLCMRTKAVLAERNRVCKVGK